MSLHSPLRSTPGAFAHRRQGFALIITIILLAMLVLLMVSMATLTRVETQIATNFQQAETARHNALTALNIAIGQLQSAAGPDQRVTARAEILDVNSTTLSTSVVKQPLWTGVWKTGSASLDIANSGVPQRQTSLGSIDPTGAQKVASATWLVSNPMPSTPVNPISYVGTASNSVNLATKVGPNQDITVTVPVVNLTGTPAGFTSAQTIGRYGYWVSDEGLKAKVNIADPTLQTTYSGAANLDPVTDLPKNILHFVGPQSIAGHKILPDTLATDFRGAPHIDRVLTPQQLTYLPATAPSGFLPNKYMADITTYSFGVLADARKGGLKKDLTAALEDSGNTSGKNYDKLNPDGRGRVYSAPGDTVPLIPSSAYNSSTTGNPVWDGLRWLNLYQHYNLYRATYPSQNLYGRTANPSASSPAGVGNPAASNRPYAVSPRGLNWRDTDTGVNGGDSISYGVLTPICLGLRWDSSIVSTAVAGGYVPQINYYFNLVLYNPYSVTINASANNFRYSRALSAGTNFYLETTVGAKVYYTNLNLGQVLQRLMLNVGFTDAQTLAPGETRVFGLNANRPVATNVLACELADMGKTTPYGLLSKNYAASWNQNSKLQVITALDAGGSKWLDTYATIPAIPSGTLVTFKLLLGSTGHPSAASISGNIADVGMATNIAIGGSASGDVSIPAALMWPTPVSSGGAILNYISGKSGSNGMRVSQGGAPGTNSTGVSASLTRVPLTLPIETLTETQVLSMFVRKKGIKLTGGTSYSNAALAVPLLMGNSSTFNMINDSYGNRYWDELYVGTSSTGWPSYPPSTGQLQISTTSSGYTTTSWGDFSTGASAANIGKRIILADVPVQPLVSLGQFMHIQPWYLFTTGNYSSLGFGSMFVGGSVACPEVPLNQSALDSIIPSPTNSFLLLMDHSFLANQALFDSYYFSTVPPAGSAPTGTTWPVEWTSFNAANSGTTLSDSTKVFLNRRITPIYTNGQPAALADIRDMDKAAAYLLLNGAFNINSTSVDAWRALLSSLSGNDLNLWNASTSSASTFSSTTLQNPLCRFTSANTDNSVNTVWSGVRALSDADVTALATAIVTEVKARGPFLSMADFLNRRLSTSNTDVSRAGALQAAIDKTPTLNSNIKSSGSTVNLTSAQATVYPQNVQAITGNMADASSTGGAALSTALGAPGYLMQQDLVQAFSPVMSARSDTFIIRAYGESVNPATTLTQSKAYLEAVVQRLPELVDAKDTALTASGSLGAATPLTSLNTTNQTFGRRFKIISFRWLSPNEL